MNSFTIYCLYCNYSNINCYRCHASEPPELALLVETKWTPLISWLHERHPVSVQSAVGFELPQVSPDSYEVLTKHLLTYNYWSVVGVLMLWWKGFF